MLLRFIKKGHNKWYAETPYGEFAWSDKAGLYEWRRLLSGELQRIDYTGADEQCSSPEGMWVRHSPLGPKLRGFREALRGYHENTN